MARKKIDKDAQERLRALASQAAATKINAATRYAEGYAVSAVLCPDNE